VTFKDLKKRVTLEEPHRQSSLFEKLQNKPFWILDIEEHKKEDVRTNGVAALTTLLHYHRRTLLISLSMITNE
jgi:hypothetical protein